MVTCKHTAGCVTNRIGIIELLFEVVTALRERSSRWRNHCQRFRWHCRQEKVRNKHST